MKIKSKSKSNIKLIIGSIIIIAAIIVTVLLSQRNQNLQNRAASCESCENTCQISCGGDPRCMETCVRNCMAPCLSSSSSLPSRSSSSSSQFSVGMCSPGQCECLGAVMTKCCDSNRQWSSPIPCGSNGTCQNGRCYATSSRSSSSLSSTRSSSSSIRPTSTPIPTTPAPRKRCFTKAQCPAGYFCNFTYCTKY